MRRSTRLLAPVSVGLLAALSIGACSSDSDGATEASADETTTTTVVEAGCTTDETGPLRILLANDDGVINPAIDVLIDRLDALEDIDVEVTVVAPADEKSGSSDSTTPGGSPTPRPRRRAATPPTPSTASPPTRSSSPSTSSGLDPQLVLSGINPGQNIGPFAPLSGTIGVGRTAIRRDYPALAVSGPLEFDDAQFDVGADLALEWITDNCEALVAGTAQTDTVTSINFPACAPAQMGELQAVERATSRCPTLPEGITALRVDLRPHRPGPGQRRRSPSPTATRPSPRSPPTSDARTGSAL